MSKVKPQKGKSLHSNEIKMIVVVKNKEKEKTVKIERGEENLGKEKKTL